MCDFLPSSTFAFPVPETRKWGLISLDWRRGHQLGGHAINIPRRNSVLIGKSVSFFPLNAISRRNSSAFNPGEFGFDVESQYKEAVKDHLDLNRPVNDLGDDMYTSMRNGGVTNMDSLSLNFLENEEEEKKSEGSSNEDDFTRFRSVDDLKKMGFRRGKRMMKRSNLLAKQVISIQSALSLGFVSQLWIDTATWTVLVVEVRPNLLSGESERFLLEDVSRVGDVVLVENESVVENDLKMVGLNTLVGCRVVTPGQRNIGKVRCYSFKTDSGTVVSLELDTFGISIIPSSLVSTYALLVEDILEVVADTIVVHETAASRIQRLTKGVLGSQNLGCLVDEVGDCSDFEEPERYNKHLRKSKTTRRNRSNPKKKEAEDDWGVPLDFL